MQEENLGLETSQPTFWFPVNEKVEKEKEGGPLSRISDKKMEMKYLSEGVFSYPVSPEVTYSKVLDSMRKLDGYPGDERRTKETKASTVAETGSCAQALDRERGLESRRVARHENVDRGRRVHGRQDLLDV